MKIINLDKYKLKQKYRKVLDNLSDDDKIKKCFSENYSIQEIGNVVTWYELEDNALLKTLGLEKFGKNPEHAYCYAIDVIKGRWKEAEEFIKQNPEFAYIYAKDLIKGRWIEAEEFIKQDPENAYCYAFCVIKGRWKEAEETIKKDPKWAYSYAYYVIKGRWIEVEEVIKKDSLWWNYYQRLFKTLC